MNTVERSGRFVYTDPEQRLLNTKCDKLTKNEHILVISHLLRTIILPRIELSYGELLKLAEALFPLRGFIMHRIFSTYSNTSHSFAFYMACANGCLEVAIWLTERFQLTPKDARFYFNSPLRCACENGYLEVAKWLTDRFHLTPKDARSTGNAAFVLACENGHLEVVKWLTERFKLSSKDVRSSGNCAIQHARENEHLEVVKWLKSQFGIQ